MRTVTVADLFCGAGGESTGIAAVAAKAGLNLDLLAVNHWDVAIDTHSRNHPGARHLCESIQNIDPRKAVPSGRLNLLWASPECTHHSVARGGRPCSDQSRASAWLVLKWLSELYVDTVVVENVPEFLMWGPLDSKGNPIKSARGQTFKAWVQALQSLGYTVDWRLLKAADYGDPTTRRRLFVQAVRGRRGITWPRQTHSESATSGMLPWVPAADIIDWSQPGTSIFDRKRPLAPATLRRIETGIQRFWGEYADPFLVVLRGTGGVRPVDLPLPALTAGGQHLGVVSSFIVQSEHDNRVHDVSHPMPTITTSSRGFGIVQPFCVIMRGQSTVRDCRQPVPTVTSGGGHVGVVRPFIVQYYGQGTDRDILQPLDTVTTKGRFAVVDGHPATLDIRFRMLQPGELAAAQGFPGDYRFSGNKTEQIRQIGNAVPCGLAEALCSAVLGV